MYDTGLLRLLNRERKKQRQRLVDARAVSAVWKRAAKSYRMLYLLLYADMLEEAGYEDKAQEEIDYDVLDQHEMADCILNPSIYDNTGYVERNKHNNELDAQKEETDTG